MQNPTTIVRNKFSIFGGLLSLLGIYIYIVLSLSLYSPLFLKLWYHILKSAELS